MQPTDQQLLDAFRYIAGEMPALEEHQFDLQLASNQALQQAVVDATKLSVTVAAEAEASSIRNTHRSPQTRSLSKADYQVSPAATRSSAKGIAAAVAIAVCAWMLLLPFAGSPVADADPSAIVSVWVEDSPAVADSDDIADVEIAEAVDSASQLDVPEWMLTALVVTEADSTEDL